NSVDFGADIMIQEKSGSLYRYELKGNYSDEDINCTYDMAGNQKNTEGNVTIDMKDIMKMIIDVESHLYETSQSPDLSLPADAKVVEYPVYPTY
ncbi:MAG: hypothetical protein AAGU75_19330, partial [Bacillota bacterium]